jgi:hypothetical protein
VEEWDQLYCTVTLALTVAVSFFQNPALNHKSNPHLIVLPSKTAARLHFRLCGKLANFDLGSNMHLAQEMFNLPEPVLSAMCHSGQNNS